MSESSRIEELRRRVQGDPASIAFAALAEEYRRAGQFDEAIETCRTGLLRHPSYLSARVTLGRSLIEVDRLDEAREELGIVLRAAPENLAAIRGLADIHQRRGEIPEALEHYRSALELSRHDPELQETVERISRKSGVQPVTPASAPDAGSAELSALMDWAFAPAAAAAPVEPIIDRTPPPPPKAVPAPPRPSEAAPARVLPPPPAPAQTQATRVAAPRAPATPIVAAPDPTTPVAAPSVPATPVAAARVSATPHAATDPQVLAGLERFLAAIQQARSTSAPSR